MSMDYCFEETFGLFLDEPTAIELTQKLAKDYGVEDYECCGAFEVGDFIDVNAAHEVIGGFKYPINENGIANMGQPISSYIVIECDKWPRMFEGCYNSVDEMVQEFKDKTYGFLSEDYIRNNLCKIVGVEVR